MNTNKRQTTATAREDIKELLVVRPRLLKKLVIRQAGRGTQTLFDYLAHAKNYRNDNGCRAALKDAQWIIKQAAQ